MSGDETSYREYVSARIQPLHRTAYLLCGDWHTADDLVSVVLAKLLRHWRRVAAMDNPDAYLRRSLLNAWLDERRRPWWRERPGPVPDERLPEIDTARRVAIMGYLDELPPRRRAVLVLRYFLDLSVEDTAAALGIGIGTVKSQAARGLETLRARMTAAQEQEREPLWT